MPDAPRDKPIKLFLPAPVNSECVGTFDKADQQWVNESGHRVYPSQWQPLK